MARADRIKRRTERKIRKGKISSPSVSVGKSTVTKLAEPKSIKKTTEGLTPLQKQNNSSHQTNNKTTRTGKGIIKEKVMSGTDMKPEDQKARERTIASMGGDAQDRQVEAYQAKQEADLQAMEAQNNPTNQALQAQKNVQAREAEAESKDQATVRKLETVNKILVGGIITLATLGIGVAASGVFASAEIGGTLIGRGASGALINASKINAAKTGLSKLNMTGIKKILASGPKKWIVKKGIAVGAGIAGTDGIMAWLASDNILTGANMYANNLGDAVTFGQMSPQEALVQIQELKETANNASNFVKLSSRVNPALWLFGKPLMINAAQSKQAIEFQEQQILRQLTGGA